MRRRNNLDVMAGSVQGNGTVTQGSGYAVTRLSAGVYKIVMPAGFRVVNAVANPFVAASAFVACTDYVDNTFIVRSFVWNTAATVGDCPFNFIATGQAA